MNMVIICGRSGSGKTTVANLLKNMLKFHRVVTYTTRMPRNGERDGKDYYFISEQRFTELIGSNFFAEWTIYNGNFYGSAKADYKDSKGVIVLDEHGVSTILASKDNELLNNCHIFLLDVSQRVALIRMLQRGDDITEAICRCINDQELFNNIEKYKDKISIINNDNGCAEATIYSMLKDDIEEIEYYSDFY